MKANELRIGNYVKASRTGEIIPAYWLTLKHLEDGNIQASGYDDSPVWESIPLTEKWLLDFGFDNSDGSDKYINKKAGFFKFRIYVSEKHKTIITRIDTADNEGDYHEAFTIDDIEYVHQLQNLYFALTGEELILKTEA